MTGTGFSDDQVMAQIEGLLASLSGPPGETPAGVPDPEAVPA
jgi:hypothetical protein